MTTSSAPKSWVGTRRRARLPLIGSADQHDVRVADQDARQQLGAKFIPGALPADPHGVGPGDGGRPASIAASVPWPGQTAEWADYAIAGCAQPRPARSAARA